MMKNHVFMQQYIYNNKIFYKEIDSKFLKRLNIEPKFTFWDKYGKIIAIPLAILATILIVMSYLV